MKSLSSYFKAKCRRLKTRATKQNIPFNLTSDDLEQLYKKQCGVCYYTGVILSIDDTEMSPSSLSVDKIIPEKGYVRGNVLLCSSYVNTLRGNTPQKEFKKTLKNHIKEVYQFLGIS